MRFEDLNQYKIFYGINNNKGVSDIFNNYMGLDSSNAVPLSISHGVDFEHCYDAMDVYSPPPIHWAYNHRIYERSKKVKPTLLMPHPWSILIDQMKLKPGKGTLVIGPPPGRSNDTKLYELIKNDIDSDWSILVKGKSGANQSIDYWKLRGVKPVTVGSNSNLSFYEDLLIILSEYENIIACTFSSALIFAASIEKNIFFLEGYSYKNYDVSNYLEKVNFRSSYSRFVVDTFVKSSKDTTSGLAKEILGFELLNQKKRIKEDYLNIISKLDSPVFCFSNNKNFFKIKLYLSKILSKPGGINKSFKDYFFDNKKSIVEMEINEISVWLNGVNDQNFNCRTTRFVKGVTIPGTAVDKYD